MSGAIFDQIKSRLTFIDDPHWGGRDAVERTLIVVSETAAAALALYQKLRGDAAAQAELAAAIRALYAEHIAPLDIPGVGPVLESIIDAQLPNILPGILAPLDAALDRVLPRQQP